MPPVNMFYDKNQVLRSGWTGKEIKRGNVPPPPPTKLQQHIKVDLQIATNSRFMQGLKPHSQEAAS